MKTVWKIGALILAGMALRLAAQVANFTDSSSYNTNGVSLSLNDSWTAAIANGNANYSSATVSNTDSPIAVNPLISNGWLRVKNVSPTNVANYVAYGNNGTNYPNVLYPGEVGRTRLSLDGSGKLHAVSSNGVQSIEFLWEN
jgi:hypothetical protein